MNKFQTYINELLVRSDAYKLDELFEFLEVEKEVFLLSKAGVSDGIENFPKSTWDSKDDDFAGVCKINKHKSAIDLRKSRSTDVLINEHFFYAENKSTRSNDSLSEHEDYFKNPIDQFLYDLNSNNENIYEIIQNFETNLLSYQSSPMHKFSKGEVYKLFFGEDKNLRRRGLLYHIGNLQNYLGALSCLDLLSKLIDYEHNLDGDQFIQIFKLGRVLNYDEMNLTEHLQSKNEKVVVNCFNIIKCIKSEERGITVENLLKDVKLVDKFYCWLIN
jgi:hypothetical protein